MDRKKKIIVVIVTLIFVGVLVAFVKMMLFPSGASDPARKRISIVTPEVDEKKIDRVSKIKEYTKGKLREGDQDTTITRFGVFGEENEFVSEQDSISGEENLAQQQNQGLKIYDIGDNSEDEFDEELRGLIELQEQLMAEAKAQQAAADAATESSSAKELESLLQTYDNYAQQYYAPPADSAPPESSGGTTTSNEDSGATKKADERLSDSERSVFSGAGHFQGAGAINKSDGSVELIPAETVDTSVLINGSTIAIRTKKEIRLKQPALLIPKGAVVYGRVSFSTDRVFIDIPSYKNSNKLYPLNFKMFDFDGREGVHLNNRTWARIPSRVAEDVYDFIYRRGTQASAFGGAQDIDLEDAQNIAILSAAREMSREVFDKRRVFMPKKYHLWLNVSGN